MSRRLVPLVALAFVLPFVSQAPAQGTTPSEIFKIFMDNFQPKEARERAAQVLVRMGPEAKALVPDLTKVVDDTFAAYWQRAAAARVLASIGADARSAIPALIKAMGKDPELTKTAGEALDVLQASPRTAPTNDVPGLVKSLQDKDESVRLKAAKSIGKLGAEGKPALAALTEALKDGDPDVRRVAARSLNAIRTALDLTDQEVALLTYELTDRDEAVRLKAAKVLGRMGASARPAIPALTEALRDPDPDVRRVARDSLDNIRK